MILTPNITLKTMSKGLGVLQRKLIEISTATQTIWEASPQGISVEVADTSEKTACGITTTAKHGFTWRKTGEPYFCAEATVHTLAELMELKAAFYAVNCTFTNQMILFYRLAGPCTTSGRPCGQSYGSMETIERIYPTQLTNITPSHKYPLT